MNVYSAGLESEITKKCEKILISLGGRALCFDSCSSGEVTSGWGGRGGRYCYNFITEAQTGLRLVGILQLLSPSGLFQPTQSALGNVIGLFSEIEYQPLRGLMGEEGREGVLEFCP